MKIRYILLLMLSIKIQAQDSLSFNKRYVAKNNVTVELVGIGSFYSINYERNFCIKELGFHTLRAGVSYVSNFQIGDNALSLPIAYTYSIGKRKSKFFAGIGFALLIPKNPSPPDDVKLGREHPQQAYVTVTPPIDYGLYPIMGYELISKNVFYFKAYATILIGRNNFIYYYAYPWAGFTFGFKLKKMR